MKAEKTIVTVLVGALVLHFSICLFVGLFPDSRIVGFRNLSAFYKIYIVPGPFFKDELIRSAPRFLISYKTKLGDWSPWQNPAAANFKAYHDDLWRYDKLKKSSLERFLAKNLARKISEHVGADYFESVEFRELHRYFADQYVPADADSISAIYVENYYSPRTKLIRSDTLFYLKYRSF